MYLLFVEINDVFCYCPRLLNQIANIIASLAYLSVERGLEIESGERKRFEVTQSQGIVK